jgi:hypothetical protein
MSCIVKIAQALVLNLYEQEITYLEGKYNPRESTGHYAGHLWQMIHKTGKVYSGENWFTGISF